MTQADLVQAHRLVRERRFDEAIACYGRLLAENDADPTLHEAIGSAYFMVGKDAEAAAHFERVTRLVVHPGKALINLGAVYNRLGDCQKAVESIRKGLQYERRSVEGYYNLGVAHRKLGQLPLAVTAYKEALRLDPNFAEAYQNLGNVYLEQGHPGQAAEAYRKALELKPGFEKARAGLAVAEQATAAGKTSAAPFGRLVDTSRTQQAGLDGFRPLSEAERRSDRQRLHDLSKEIESAAADWLDLLRGDFDSALAALNKQLARGAVADLADAVEEFGRACDAAAASRQRLRRKVLELVAHEELLHAPG